MSDSIRLSVNAIANVILFFMVFSCFQSENADDDSDRLAFHQPESLNVDGATVRRSVSDISFVPVLTVCADCAHRIYARGVV